MCSWMRYTGQSDIAVGVPAAARSRPSCATWWATSPTRWSCATTSKAGAASTELLKRVRRTARAALVHQEMPFDRLVAELRPGTRCRPESALPGRVRARQLSPSPARTRRTRERAGPSACPHLQVRSFADDGRIRRRTRGLVRVPHRPVRGADHRAPGGALRPSAARHRRRSRRPAGPPAADGCRRAAPDAVRLEPAAPRRGARAAGARTLPGPGASDARGRRAALGAGSTSYRELDLLSDRLAGELRALGVEARGGRRPLHAALHRPGGGPDGDLQGRRRLSSAGPRPPDRAAAGDAGRCDARRGVDAGGAGGSAAADRHRRADPDPGGSGRRRRSPARAPGRTGRTVSARTGWPI